MEHFRSIIFLVVALYLGDYCVSTQCASKSFKMCKDMYVPNNIQHFNIKNENYDRGENYAADRNCHLLLDARPHPVVLVLHFKVFDVESEPICAYDNLQIAGRRYCGNWLAGRTLKLLIDPFKIVEFHFTTDFSISGKGFKINVDIIPYSEGERVSVYMGPGSRFVSSFTLVGYTELQQGNETTRIIQAAGRRIPSRFRYGLLGFLDHFPKDSGNDANTTESIVEKPVTPDGSKDIATVLRDQDGSIWFDVDQKTV